MERDIVAVFLIPRSDADPLPLGTTDTERYVEYLTTGELDFGGIYPVRPVSGRYLGSERAISQNELPEVGRNMQEQLKKRYFNNQNSHQ